MTAKTNIPYVLALIAMAFASSASAQTSVFEVSTGYLVARASDQILPLGWSLEVARDFGPTWSIVGEVGGNYKTTTAKNLGVDVDLRIHTAGIGARWSTRSSHRIVPFAQVVAGAARVGASAKILGVSTGDSSTDFMLMPGGGLKVRLLHAFGVVGHFDYRRVFIETVDHHGSPEHQFSSFIGLNVSR